MTRSGEAPGQVPRPQPMRGGRHLAEWACELVGTALLVLGGLSAVCLDFGPGSPVATAVPSGSARLLLTGLLFAGSGSLVAVSPLGRRSGAHLNPAVTLGFWTLGHLHRDDLVGYLLAQLAGATAGAGLTRLLWGRTLVALDGGRTLPGHGLGVVGAALVEAAMTAGLLLLIVALVSGARTARWTPLAVWLYVAALVWQVAPYTGTSLNPARSLGPDVVAGTFAALAVYVVGPMAGALLTTALWRAAGARRTLTAKLFHDPRYRTTMASALPAMGPAGG